MNYDEETLRVIAKLQKLTDKVEAWPKVGNEHTSTPFDRVRNDLLDSLYSAQSNALRLRAVIVDPKMRP